MKSNFHSNQILYIKGIGYARLAINQQKDPKNNDASKTALNSNIPEDGHQENNENMDGVLFDPDMFRIDADSPFGQTEIESNIPQQATRKQSIEVQRRQSSQIKHRQLIILPLKLEHTNAMVYCPETHLMKKITINVKSLIQNCRKQVQIPIQIIKTIDNFKTVLFKELGEDIAFYSDIKLYTITPRMEELNIGSKTIWQCQLKDKCKITLAAKFNFTFKALPKEIQEKFLLENGNNTLNFAQKKVEPPANTTSNVGVIVLPSSTEQVKKPDDQQNPQPPTEPKTPAQQPKAATQPRQKQKSPQTQKNPTKVQSLHIECNSKFRSGINYWEIKIDKLSPNKDQNSLLIGICLKNEETAQTKNYIQLWAFDPIRCKKVDLSDEKKLKMAQKVQKDDKEQIAQDSSDQDYGCFVKNGDAVGVLLIIKEKKATLIFYKNGTCLEECYEFSLERLKDKVHKNAAYLCPFISVKGEIQVTLDSKAVPPLDSYRFK